MLESSASAPLPRAGEKEITMCHEHLTAPVAGGAGIVDEQVETPGAGRTIPGYLARPETGTGAGVLVIHDIWGANPFYHDLTRRLAGEGYVALLPDLFVREGPIPENEPEARHTRRAKWSQVSALEDIAGAIRWLKDQPQCSGKVATIGFCMGGTLIFLQAAREPLPDASIAYYGFPKPDPTPLAPFVPIDEASQVKSKLLAFWGDQDHGVGMDKVEQYRASLDAAGIDYEAVVYPGMPHGFITFDSKSPNYEAAQDSWKRSLAFLKQTVAA
jgi:carboxymethylenebutenolidase